ncbi:MAG TPA: NAD(P)H-dependent oxidoreductase [Flavobacteriales bacterium]|nr:NAD(P)H-dependent oxidoreductase [Flavobacteriales bacterium]HPH83292.1 NAD(P)H-dependent oxidoreductase [Flavobacteriales bacterium]
MKKILVIQAHPDPESFNAALAKAYIQGAENAGAEVKLLVISELKFDPVLRYGYRKRTELEPDLVLAWEWICWADHLVWVHPVWWGGLPALSKGFIDLLFLPGMAFSYKENSNFQIKLLRGKTANILTTLDQPGWYYWLMYGRPSVNMLKRSTLQFCGINPVQVNYFGIVRNSNAAQRKKWLRQARLLGEKLK